MLLITSLRLKEVNHSDAIISHRDFVISYIQTYISFNKLLFTGSSSHLPPPSHQKKTKLISAYNLRHIRSFYLTGVSRKVSPLVVHVLEPKLW